MDFDSLFGVQPVAPILKQRLKDNRKREKEEKEKKEELYEEPDSYEHVEYAPMNTLYNNKGLFYAKRGKKDSKEQGKGQMVQKSRLRRK